MDPTQQMVIAVITSSAVTGAVTGMIKYFIDRHDRKNGKAAELENSLAEVRKTLAEISKMLNELTNDVNNLKKDDIVILHDCIYKALTFLSKFEKITITDRCNVDYIFERYKENGGNHKAELMYEAIKQIPVVDEDGNILKMDQ